MKSFVTGFGRFWYDFIIGDDWKIAVAVISALALTVGGLVLGLLGTTGATVFGGITLLVAFAVSMIIDVRRTPAASTPSAPADQR